MVAGEKAVGDADVMVDTAGAADVELLIPEVDPLAPELSIVIPALNESLTIVDFVTWCKEGLASAGITGEILIIDSSTDDTARLAVDAGARVLRVPRRGLGRAYKDALPYIRGRWVLMGDADCTYDFRQLVPFVEEFRAGFELVMGSRWRGTIEDGAMPGLHRYLGTPVTTWILNRLYSSHFSDIHCGMRGITLEALQRMELDSESWEYASEMVLKSVRMGLRTTEVPVTFLKDREGRLSHHKRAGWFSPWAAAWINLRAMFVYGSDFFLLKPGAVLFVLGLLATLPLSFGPIRVSGITFSLYWMLLGVTLTVVGLQSFLLGVIAQVQFDYRHIATARWTRVFPYTRTVIGAFVGALAGAGLAIPLLVFYFSHHEQLTAGARLQDGLAVTGLLLIIVGASLAAFTLVLHATVLATGRGRRATS
jgi:glycosyltransferase involved in cell wall biosynthesis